jgi:hypothetical protein
MSFNPPSTITFSGGAWQTSGRYYSHIGSGLYNLRNSDGTSNSSDKDIKFTDSSGTLTLDVNPTTGTAAPSTFSSGGSDVTSGTVVAGDTINLKEAGAVRASFTLVSFYTSGGGGGTSTEGSSYSGTLTVNGTSLEYEIPATSSSGTYELKADGTTQSSIVHGSTASTGSAPNFDQTKIWILISPAGDELDEIDLTGTGGTLTKKVFCNFW